MPRRRFRYADREEEGTLPAQVQTQRGSDSDSQAADIQLSSLIGNQAMQRMLIQREGETGVNAPGVTNTVTNTNQNTQPGTGGSTAPGLLSKTQVMLALSYYNMRSKDYTPQIISQIQQALGVEVTGKATAEMVQAVAEFQTRDETGGLKVDGMAGPRTLPFIFKQGLEEEDRMEEFAEEALDLQDEWDGMADADERAEALMDLVNEKLAESQVRECDFVVKDLPDLLGQFDFETWTIEIGKPAFDKSPLTDAEFNDAVNTIYHESRHAEQWFCMARMLAGQKKSAAKIAEMMAIPLEVATEAVGKPFDPKSMEALVANGWYESVYGVDAQKRNATFKELEAADIELEAARKAVEKNDNATNRARLQRATERQQRAYAAYHNLPEETDAHRVGDKLAILMQLKQNMPEDS